MIEKNIRFRMFLLGFLRFSDNDFDVSFTIYLPRGLWSVDFGNPCKHLRLAFTFVARKLRYLSTIQKTSYW